MIPVEPPRAETILHVLCERAAATPDELAFSIDDGDSVTWGDLLDGVRAEAGRLAALGVEPGEVCGLQLPTGLAAIRLLFALQWLGAVPVCLGPGAAAARRAAELGCRRLFTAAPAAAGGAATAPPAPAAGPDDVAYLQLTSGTSGEPRAAAITHRNLMAALGPLHGALAIHTRDVLVSWLPLHHDYGLVHFVFGALFFGRPAHLLQPALTRVRRWLETVARVRGTITGSPDSGLRLAARAVSAADLDLSCLRFAGNGGEPVRHRTIVDFETRFSVPGVVRPGYGMAETTLAASLLRPGMELRRDALGNVSCGPPLAGFAIRIIDPLGRPVPAGVGGEIAIRGPAVFNGYWGAPEASRRVLRDGWLHTGDLGSLDADGHLYVSGRRRAVLKRAGALIPARVIEEAAEAVAGVRLAAAVPWNDGEGVEEAVVVAEVRGGQPPARRREIQRQIEASVREEVGFPPREVVLARPGSIPRTGNGKLRHARLAVLYGAGELAPAG